MNSKKLQTVTFKALKKHCVNEIMSNIVLRVKFNILKKKFKFIPFYLGNIII